METIQLDWSDGPSVSVPALWLRDNCPCSECRVVATAERRKLIASEPLHLTAVTVTAGPGNVTVDWGNHISDYSLDWYRGIQLEVNRHQVAPRFWAADLVLPRYRHADLDESTGDGRRTVVEFLTRLAESGLAIVSDVPGYPGESERFLSRWAPVRELPFGRVHDVWVDPAGYNIAHTAEALPPHNDFASYEWPPSGQILHMLVNEAEGGDSVVVDGWRVAEELEDDELDILARFPVPFRQFAGRCETWTRAPLITRRADGSVGHLRFSNQLMQPLDPNAPEIDRFYGAYHHLSCLVLDERNQHHFRLDAGDLLVVHGRRVLHGRSAYDPTSGSRHLQDVYFEFDDLINQLYRLEHQPA